MSGLSCAQTPPQFTTTIPPIDLLSNSYGNAGLRLSALVAGPGLISNPGNNSGGIVVDENPQSVLTVNGIQYNFLEMRFFHGAHKVFVLPSGSTPASAPLEAYIFFHNTNNKIVCLVLPIGIDSKTGTGASAYINLLAATTGQMGAILTTLFQDLSGSNNGKSFNAQNEVLTYLGQDVRSLAMCDPSSTAYPVTYFFIMNDPSTKLISSTITQDEFNKLTNNTLSTAPTMNLPGNRISLTDASLLRKYPGGMFFISIGGKGTQQQIPINSLESLKCYPVNPKKNIQNNTLYLDENGVPTTLESELGTSASPRDLTAVPSGWAISPAAVEGIIAGVVALMLASIGFTLWYKGLIPKPSSTLGTTVAATTSVSTAVTAAATTPSLGILLRLSNWLSGWWSKYGIIGTIVFLLITIVILLCTTLYFAGVFTTK